MAAIGALAALGVLGGLGYYVYTRIKGSAPAEQPAEADTRDSNSMELRSSRRRILYGSRVILRFSLFVSKTQLVINF